MKKILLFIQLFTLVLLGLSSIEVYAVEEDYNRNVTIANQITEGDFETDTDGDGFANNWYGRVEGEYIAGGVTNREIVDGVQRIWEPSGYSLLATYIELTYEVVITFTDNDIYYFSTYIDTSLESIPYLYVGGNEIPLEEEDTGDTDFSLLFSYEDYDYTNLYMFYNYTPATTLNLYADNVILVNLTTYFGEGKEPSLLEFEAILEDNEVGEFFNEVNLSYYDSDPDGDINTLSTMISALYESYTFTDFEDTLVGEENILNDYPILNEVYGNIIPPLTNTFEDYSDDFYIKTSRTYDTIINSTYADIIPLEAEPILNSVYGLSLNSLPINGNFSDGTNDWTASGGTTFTVTSEIATFLADSLYDRLGNVISVVSGVDYYIEARVKSTSTGVRLYLYDTANRQADAHSGSGEYEILKGIITAGTTLATGEVRIIDNRASAWDNIYIDYVMAIPITNTPLHSHTATQINGIVQEYIEGYTPITNFELQSVGVNLFDNDWITTGTDLTVSGTADNLELYSSSFTGETVINVLPTIYYKPLTQYTFSGIMSHETDGKNLRLRVYYEDGSYDRMFTTTLTPTYFTFTSDIDKTISKITTAQSLVGGRTYIDNFIFNEGIVASDYVIGNSPTNFKLTTDLLSLGTTIRDEAYYNNGLWWKDKYIEVNEFIGLNLGTEVIETNNTSYYTASTFQNAINMIDQTDSIDGEIEVIGFNEIGLANRDDTTGYYIYTTLDGRIGFVVPNGTYADLATARTELDEILINYILETMVTVEIVQTGSLIQESNTTLVQIGQLATEYDIDFITSLDDSNTDYYYSEVNSLLVDLVDSYGSGNEPTLAEFEDILDYIGLSTFTEYLGLDYIEDFTLQTTGGNLFDNTLTYTVGRFQTSGVIDPSYTTARVSNYVEIDENTEYIINNNSSATYNHSFYDESYSYLGYISASSATFTTPNNAKYVRLNTDSHDDYINLQLNKGTEIFDLTTYNSSSITLLTDLLRIGDIRDRAYSVNEDLDISDNEVWYKDQYIGRDYNDVVQSATTWSIYYALSNTHSLYKTYADLGLDVNGSNDNDVISNGFLKIGDVIFEIIDFNDFQTSDTENICAIVGTQLHIRVNKTTYATSEDFETYLQSNDVEFIYELDTPILATEISYTGSLIQEENLTLNQIDNLFTEYQIDIMTEEPYLSTRFYEDITEINPFYQYDDYELSVDDEPIINLTLKETMYYQFDSYPEIYIAKYDIEGNYIADIFNNYIYDFSYVGSYRLHNFEYTLPITSAEEEMYMWIAYNGIGGTVLGAGYVAEAPSTAFNTAETGIRSLEYALGINDSVYLDIASGYQYDHTTENYVIDSDNPIIIAHFRSEDDNADIVFYNENTEDTYSISLSDVQNDFSNNEIIDYKIYNSFVVISASNELLGSMDYLLSLDISIDSIEDLDVIMTDYTDIFNGYNDLGVFTYNIMDGVTIEAQGEAPIFYEGNPYIIDMTNHSIRYGNIVNVTLDKVSENFDNEYDNYYLYDSNSVEYFTNDFDVFAYDNILRYVLYEGFDIDEATITFKAESSEDYLNGTDKSDYYISLSDTYEMRGATGIQDGVDGWLDSVSLSGSTAKTFVSVIVIIGFTILLAKLQANFVTILIVDFGVIGLLALLGFIPLWIILFIIIVVMVLIFFTRRE